VRALLLRLLILPKSASGGARLPLGVLRPFYATGRNGADTFLVISAEVAVMQLRREKPVSALIDWVGAACAYAIILGMLATALAPLITPLLPR
jgi:hypothetical protein